MPRTIAEKQVLARMPTVAILEEERVIKLSAASSEALFAIMENPPEPNKYLKEAMQHHEKALCRK